MFEPVKKEASNKTVRLDVYKRQNAILLPYIVAYNGQKPTKFAIFPKYETFVADKKFAKIAKQC